jgi:MFS family permease
MIPSPQRAQLTRAPSDSPAASAPSVRLLAVLLAGQSLANVDTAIVNVAAPSIRNDLRASGAQLELVVSAYVLAYAVLLVTGARLGTIWGYRRVFAAGVAGFTLASLACGLAPEPVPLIAARLVQGASAALLVPQVLTGIQTSYTGSARERALGLFVVALAGSAVVGQILGGVLIFANLGGLSWRPVFLINVPIGAALVPVSLRYLPPETGRRTAQLDLAGASILTLALALLLVPLSLGREAGWPPWIWLCLAGSVAAFIAFAAVEWRVVRGGGSAIVDLKLVARGEVGWALISRGAASGTYFALLFVIAIYLQQGLGLSPLYSGLALVAWVAAFGIGGPLFRRLPPVLGRRSSVSGAVIMALAYLGITAGVATGLTAGGWLIALLGVGGFGFGLTTTALLAHLTSAVSGDAAADLSGLYNTNSQVAAVVGIACFGTLYLAVAGDQSVGEAQHAFATVCGAFGLTALLAAAAARRAVARNAMSPRRRRRDSRPIGQGVQTRQNFSAE